MSVYGLIDQKTMENWNMWSGASFVYLHDLYVNCQMELLRGLRQGVNQLHMRAMLLFPAEPTLALAPIQPIQLPPVMQGDPSAQALVGNRPLLPCV